MNPFAEHQRAKAEARAAVPSGDEASRERAVRRAEAWGRACARMASGEVVVGSRVPTAAPAWATLVVLHGGFASGDLAAALKEGESNADALTDEGVGRLLGHLERGDYAVELPEHSALLAAVWLAKEGREEAAQAVANAIAPWMDRLRFYPEPAAPPPPDDALVPRSSVWTVEQVAEQLSNAAEKYSYASGRRARNQLAEREALLVWRPLARRAEELLAETVAEGEAPPELELDAAGRPARDDAGAHAYRCCSWPLQRFRGGWLERASALVAEAAAAAAAQHRQAAARRVAPLNRRRLARGSLARMLAALRACVSSGGRPVAMRGREVGLLRVTLAARAAKRRWLAERGARLRADPPQSWRGDRAAEVAARLSALPRHAQRGGLDDPAVLAGPGPPCHPSILATLERCRLGTPAELVARGLVPSGEVLATVVTRVAAAAGTASAASDPSLRRLLYLTAVAFSRRRSLLLLNLERQVRVEELPWVAALRAAAAEGGRGADEARSAEALEALAEVSGLAIHHFPHAMLPNKLLQSLRALAEAAGADVPLVEELAADIFMGALTPKFVASARVAARVMGSTAYEAYYGLGAVYAGVLASDSPVELARACTVRAGLDPPAAGKYCHRRPSENGRIIEQVMVVTTHNLAQLTDALRLAGAADDARRAWREVCRLLADGHGGSWRTRLRRSKQAAYAWRQAVFFVSVSEPADVREALALSLAAPDRASDALAARLAGLRDDLVAALRHGRTPDKAFYGWL